MTVGTGASREAEGTCFEDAVARLLRLRSGAVQVRARVAHGLPIGTGGAVEGKRYWHAWLEFKMDPRSDTYFVFDPTIGQDGLVVSRSAYYEIAQLTDEHVWRFDYEQVVAEIDARQHWGPWVDGWEELEEV